MPESRFQRTLAAIDAVNAGDPNVIRVNGVERPKELAHAEMVSRWLENLAPNASESLKLAGRAHHLERWVLPRSQSPDGRKGYLDWRRKLQQHHSQVAGRILTEAGYPESVIKRVQDILQKKNLKRAPEAQAFEDSRCLVFLEPHLPDVAARLASDKMVDVLRLTLPKMSPEGRRAALAIELAPEDRELLERAIEATAQS